MAGRAVGPRVGSRRNILNPDGSGGFRGVCICQKSSSGLLSQHFPAWYINYTAEKEI